MAWKRSYHWDKEPSFIEQMLPKIGFLLALGVPFGFWVDFVPREVFKDIGVKAALVSAVIATGFGYWKMLTNPTPQFARANLIVKVLCFLFFPIFPVFTFWMFFIHSAPALFTLAFGQPYEITSTFEKEHSYNSRSCDYRIRSEVLAGASPSFLCLSEDFYKRTSNEYRLVGKKSVVGVYYSGVYGKVRQQVD